MRISSTYIKASIVNTARTTKASDFTDPYLNIRLFINITEFNTMV